MFVFVSQDFPAIKHQTTKSHDSGNTLSQLLVVGQAILFKKKLKFIYASQLYLFMYWGRKFLHVEM